MSLNFCKPVDRLRAIVWKKLAIFPTAKRTTIDRDILERFGPNEYHVEFETACRADAELILQLPPPDPTASGTVSYAEDFEHIYMLPPLYVYTHSHKAIFWDILDRSAYIYTALASGGYISDPRPLRQATWRLVKLAGLKENPQPPDIEIRHLEVLRQIEEAESQLIQGALESETAPDDYPYQDDENELI